MRSRHGRCVIKAGETPSQSEKEVSACGDLVGPKESGKQSMFGKLLMSCRINGFVTPADVGGACVCALDLFSAIWQEKDCK